MGADKAVLLDVVETNSLFVLSEIGEQMNLDMIYQLIRCDLVDAVAFPNKIDVWVDDEGLLKSGNKVVGYEVAVPDKEENIEMKLAGNALFLSRDEEGNSVGMTDEQVEWIKENVNFYIYGEVK